MHLILKSYEIGDIINAVNVRKQIYPEEVGLALFVAASLPALRELLRRLFLLFFSHVVPTFDLHNRAIVVYTNYIRTTAVSQNSVFQVCGTCIRNISSFIVIATDNTLTND